MKTMKKTVVTLIISHEKELPDLPQLCAGRAWTLDGVRFVEVTAAKPIPIEAEPKLNLLGWGSASPIPDWMIKQ